MGSNHSAFTDRAFDPTLQIPAPTVVEKEAANHRYKQYLRHTSQQVALRYEDNNCPRESIKNFRITEKLSSGSFGLVAVGTYLKDGKQYAIKVQEKEHLAMQRIVRFVCNEKRLLYALASSFVVELKFCAKDSLNVYLIMELTPLGDFRRCVLKHKAIRESKAKIYAAQLVLAIEYLHSASVLYRDLKPQNCLVFPDGYLKLSDFGLSKMVAFDTMTVCGTPAYFPPEMVLRKPYGKSVDWWAFGIVVYEMVVGVPPFRSPRGHPEQLQAQIVRAVVPFPSASERCETFSRPFQRLVTGLLGKEPHTRLGLLARGADDIKNHEWFEEVNFEAVFNKTYKLKTNFRHKRLTPIGNAVRYGTDNLGDDSLFHDF